MREIYLMSLTDYIEDKYYITYPEKAYTDIVMCKEIVDKYNKEKELSKNDYGYAVVERMDLITSEEV